MEFGIPARLKAARQLAGYTNVKALADAMEARGLKTTTLRGIEQGARTAETHELREIAACCGLPLEWFTADFSRLSEISENPRTVIARETAAAVERARARRAGNTEETQPPRAEGAGS